MADPGPPRSRAARVDTTVRRALLLDAAESLLAEGDPLLVTFDEVARAAGVSRALIHKHVGDRRGLIDAVQARVVARLDRWVAHGLDRAASPDEAMDAITFGVWSFVEAEGTGWSVLVATGGLDHPAAHALRARWVEALAGDDPAREPAAALVTGGLLAGVGTWLRRGVDVDDVRRAMRASLGEAP